MKITAKTKRTWIRINGIYIIKRGHIALYELVKQYQNIDYAEYYVGYNRVILHEFWNGQITTSL